MLGAKQQLFSRLVALFVLEVYARGYTLSFGEAKRSDEQAEINAIGPEGRKALCAFLKPQYATLASKIGNNTGSGIRNTLHEVGLAIDFNLFKEGTWLSKTEDWAELGRYWESLDPLCRWGGHFGDGNHISLEHEGKK